MRLIIIAGLILLTIPFAYADTIDFMAEIEMMKAHLHMSLLNKEKGNDELAVAHAGHPIGEHYTNIKGYIQDPSLAKRLEDKLTSIFNNARGLSYEDYKNEIDEAINILDEAIEKVVGEEANNQDTIMKVIIKLLKESEAEYEEGISEAGNIGNIIEYQDAQAYTIRAKLMITKDVGDFKLVYKATPNSPYFQLQHAIQEMKIFEKTVDELNKVLSLPSDVEILFEECGEVNAFYMQDTKQIVMCYELIEYVGELFAPYVTSVEELGTDVVDTTYFVFFHELGHALIDIHNIPVIGREEDAVDNLATLTFLEAGAEDTAVKAAEFFYLQGVNANIQQLAFWDEHSLDMQRFYNILCLIYGKDPVKYAYLVEEGILPSERAIKCGREYQKASESWEKQLSPHFKKENELTSSLEQLNNAIIEIRSVNEIEDIINKIISKIDPRFVYTSNMERLLSEIVEKYEQGDYAKVEELLRTFTENYNQIEKDLQYHKELNEEWKQLLNELVNKISNKASIDEIKASADSLKARLDIIEAKVIPEFPIGLIIVLSSIIGIAIMVSRLYPFFRIVN